MRGDEAVERVQRILTATANRGKVVLIIHGLGHGILRNRIRAELPQMPEVRDIRYGEDCLLPGLSGVTEVLLW